MPRLRDRMESDLILAGKAETTREKYIACVLAFLAYFDTPPPARLGREDVRAFLLHKLLDCGVGASTYVVYLAALKFRPPDLREIEMTRVCRRGGGECLGIRSL